MLLQSIGRGKLALSINIEAEETVRLGATYAESLPLSQGVYTYRFPLSFLQAFPDADHFRLDLDITQPHAWQDLDVTGPFPAAPQTLDERHARLLYESDDLAPTQDLAVAVTPTAQGYTSSILLSNRSADAAILLNLVPPGFGHTPLPLDIVFVLDHSGSMKGTKMDQAKAALTTIVGELRSMDRFALVRFNDTVHAQAEELLSPTSTNVDDAEAWLVAVAAEGATHIEGGVSHALGTLGEARSTALPTIVLITDGLPTAGITAHPEILAAIEANNTAEARIHTIGIGFDQDDAFLSEIATANRGFYVSVSDDASVQESLEDFYARISSPVLRDVAVDFEGFDVRDAHPDPLPDVYHGGNLVVAARADTRSLPDPLVAHLTGREASGDVSIRMEISTSGLAAWPEVDRLWARQKANSLERAFERNDDLETRTRLQAELLQLGLTHQIETAQTSWILTTLVDSDTLVPEFPVSGAAATYAMVTGTATLPQGAADNPGATTGSPATTRTSNIAGIIVVLLLAGAAVALRRRR